MRKGIEQIAGELTHKNGGYFHPEHYTERCYLRDRRDLNLTINDGLFFYRPNVSKGLFASIFNRNTLDEGNMS